jgi:hypothetical protein
MNIKIVLYKSLVRLSPRNNLQVWIIDPVSNTYESLEDIEILISIIVMVYD